MEEKENNMAQFNKQKRPMNNFFTKAIERYGENFVIHMNAMDMRNGAISLFRDLAKGKIDVEKHGHYFLNEQLVDNFILEAQAKLMFHSINFNALNWYMANAKDNSDPLQATLNQNKNCMIAYDIIVNHLVCIKSTQNINYLYAMMHNLRQYRNNI
jgi:hypothetical protein